MNIVKELFFGEYFGLLGIVGKPFGEERFFEVAADLFCLTAEEKESYRREALQEVAHDIRTVDDYSRYMRIKEYEEMQGHADPCDGEADSLITVKGEALKAVAKYELNVTKASTEAQIASVLSANARRGNVVALRALGLLQSEGAPGYEDKGEKGVKNLLKAARWGDLLGGLALIRYDAEGRKANAKILASVLADDPYDLLIKRVEDRYGISLKERSLEVEVIKKAIAHNKIDPLHYDTGIGCVAFSPVLSIEDKKRVLYTGNINLIGEVCELPIRLRYEPITVDQGAFDRVSPELSFSKEAISSNLANADLRNRALYVPLCLSTDSDYVCRLATSLVKELFPSAKVTKVDASDIKPRDLGRSKNNVFVRDLSRSQTNVLLFVISGDVEDVVLEEITDFLSGEKRADFNLDAPAISIDLSTVLPICICDRENARKLARETEVVELSEVGAHKIADMVNRIFEERKRAYHLETLTLSSKASDLIATLPIDVAESVIDRTLRAYRAKGSESVVTEGAVRNSMKATHFNTYGFGGNNYDEN